ncbi:MAG TPA: PQQ-binding-like beta-propeller repeat protein, partial [Polyangia bacterium]|nr:PQQ-binding-like beta-propeller repeat protein [Polyangia bacterium]
AAAVTADQVIIGANGGHYYSFDLATGAVRWSYDVDGIVNLSAPVILDGRAFMLPGGTSGKLHAVDLATGQSAAGWPIELPAPATTADVTAKLLSSDHAISSLAAVDGKIIFDVRFDAYFDLNQDAVPDRFELREYVMAVDAATGDILWQRANGSTVLTDGNQVPKLWLCPTPALYQTASGPLVAVSSTLTANVRVLDPRTGAERWVATTSAPTQISPALANGRLFFGAGGALHGALSSVNQPPSTPVLFGSDGRSISAASATLRWSPSLDPNGDSVTYQLRVGRDGDLLESWEHEITTAPGQTAVKLPVRLDTGVTYTYSVRARDSKAAWSDWSPPGSFVATLTPSVSIDGQTQSDLATALQSATPGTVITLGAGTFNLSDTIRVPGGVTLQGAGPSRTILDARGLAVGVTLEGSAAGQPTQMSKLTVTGATVGVAFRDTRDAVLRNVIIRDNTEAGVEVSANASAQVMNATLLRNQNGVKSFGSVLVKNSVLAQGHTAFWSDSSNAIASKFNDSYNNSVDYRNVERGLGDFNAEVGWVDAANNDLHVLAHQPSTDRGDPDDDFSQEPQPNGGRINLGAFGGTDEAELSGGAVIPPPTPHHGDGGCALAAAPGQGHDTNDATWLWGPIFLALAFTSRRPPRARQPRSRPRP